MISFKEARDIVDRGLPEVDATEEIEIDKALMRVCSRDVFARENVLNFNRCAVDGFAMRSEDIKLTQEKGLRVLDSIDAGETTGMEVGRGECIQVATGCVLPQNCDMVVMVEDTRFLGKDKIVVLKKIRRRNFDDIGSDVKEGEKVLSKGEALTPAKIGLLAASGNAKVEVYRKLRIGLIITGDELIDIKDQKGLVDGKIYDSNSYIIKAILRNFFNVKHYGIVKDEKKVIEKTLEEALKDNTIDIIIMTGGTSMGEKDLVYKIIEEKGDMLFHKVFIKPGKPTFFGKIKDKFILGLPGNPTSAFIIQEALFLPILFKKSHMVFKQKRISAILKEDVETGERDSLMPFKLKEETGKLFAKNTFKHSGAISSVSDADGYAMVPANSKLKKGEKIDISLFLFRLYPELYSCQACH